MNKNCTAFDGERFQSMASTHKPHSDGGMGKRFLFFQLHLQKRFETKSIETRESECWNGLTSNGWFKKQRGY